MFGIQVYHQRRTEKSARGSLLALSPELRFRKFLELSHASRMLFGAPKEEDKGNFVLYHRNYYKNL